MELQFPFHRFEEFGSITAGERAALSDISDPPSRFRKGARIREEGKPARGFYLLVAGWVTASHTLPSGGRQILKVHLPGDAVGTPGMSTLLTVEELTALSDVTVLHVPFQKFALLFDTHPRVAAKFMLSIQLERVALMDRLASIGRTTAQQRVAAFILDLMDRLDPLGLVTNDTFFMALTQDQIADVVSLTPVHTNRALKSLTDEGMIARQGALYSIRDRSLLARFAARTDRERNVNPAWLPQSRS